MEELIKILHNGSYSCVIANHNEVRTFTQRGIIDLYSLLKNEPDFLNGASVADKVVGKGAAALMILGKVKEIYTDIISTSALELLKKNGVAVNYGTKTDSIRNRDNTGFCPVETLCNQVDSPTDMLPLIEEFIKNKITKNNK